MNRIAIAGTTILLTFTLGILAIAVAQRDSRDRSVALADIDPEYANETPQPIAIKSEVPVIHPDLPENTVPKELTFDRVIEQLETSEEQGNSEPEVAAPAAINDPRIQLIARQGLSDLNQDVGETETPETPPSYIALAAGEQAGFSSVPAPAVSNRPSPSLLSPPSAVPQPSSLPGASGVLSPPVLTTPTTNTRPNSTLAQPPAAATLAPPIPTFGQNPNTSLPVQGASPTQPSGPTMPPSMPPSTSVGYGVPTPPAFPPAQVLANPSAQLGPPQTDLAAKSSRVPPFPANAINNTPTPTYPAGNSNDYANSSPATPPRDLPRTQDLSTASMTRMPYAAASPYIALASDAPGSRQIDGAQNPSLQIHKKAPEEVQVGQPATFAVLVRNVGNSTAYDVVVVDVVPKGTRLASTNPPAESKADGTLVWNLGEMAAGTEQVLTVELIPESEGEIGSVASVNFAAQASVRTVSTQPKLIVKQMAESSVLLGESLTIRVTVTNEGTGIARGVALEEDVPQGFRHPKGSSLGVPLGDLAPGQSKSTELDLNAIEAGKTRNIMRAVSANTSAGESTHEVEVVAPRLRADVSGPKLRYLERQATYEVSVTNDGTSMAYDVEIIANLPRGLQFNAAGNHGEYLSSKHAIRWALEELPVGATAKTEMTLLPVEEGEFAIRMQSRAVGVEAEPVDKQVRIEGQSELAFSIDDDNDPIETNGETTYLVRVSNNGTRIDEAVQLMIEVPNGARLVDVKAPVAFQQSARGIVFDPIPQMRAKDEQLFRFVLQLPNEGIQIVRAHLKSKLRPDTVVNEESTQVYRDR